MRCVGLPRIEVKTQAYNGGAGWRAAQPLSGGGPQRCRAGAVYTPGSPQRWRASAPEMSCPVAFS